MPSISLDVHRGKEGETFPAPHDQSTMHPAPATSDSPPRRNVKPLPLTRHLSLEPAAQSRPREVSSPFPTGTPSRPSTQSPNGHGLDFLIRASEEVLKVHPGLDRAYLLDIMEEHYPKCTKDHIVQCTIQHFANRPDYPKAQEGSNKRKIFEGDVGDGPDVPVATRRRIGGTPSLASSSDSDSLECESCRASYHAKATSSCPAGHLFCHLCIFKAVSSQLNSEEPLVVCLNTVCPHPFTRATLLDILPHEPLGLYDALINNHTIRQSQRIDSCPRCEWVSPAGVSLPTEQTKRFCCDSCGSITCRVCKSSAHGLISCKDAESQRRKSQEASSDSDSLHDSRTLTPDYEQVSLPPISPSTNALPSAGEGPSLPSLRSTLALGSAYRL